MIHKKINISEIKAADSESGNLVITGYASTFNNLDAYNDTIKPGAYANVIKSGIMPKMFLNHDHMAIPVGKWTAMSEDSKGLAVEGYIFKDNSNFKDLRTGIKEGAIDGLSIGYSLKRSDYEYSDDTDIRTINNISKLREVSVVTFPADEYAKINTADIKSIMNDFKSIKDFERFLRDECNLSSKAAKTFISSFKNIVRDEQKTIDASTITETFKIFKLGDYHER